MLASEPKVNLNIYKYNALSRIDGSYNFIKFYAYYFGNYNTLSKDFGQKNHATLYKKIDLNLHLMQRTFRTINFFNVSETKTYRVKI